MISDRKKRIREHLAKSSGGETDFQRIPQNVNGTTSSTSSEKKSIKEHLTRSLGNYDLTSKGGKQEQKNRVMEHVNISKGKS